MFLLVTLHDTVRIPPAKFAHELDAIAHGIKIKYFNKVIKDVGLVVTLYEVTALGEQYVSAGDGVAHAKVHFTLVVFRPPVGAVLTGRVKAANADGLQLTLGFFDDVFVLPASLPPEMRFQPADQCWVWRYALASEAPTDLLMAPGFDVRFRVASVQFRGHDHTKPTPPPPTPAPSQLVPAAPPPADIDGSDISAMMLLASMNEPGLGVLEWWADSLASSASGTV